MKINDDEMMMIMTDHEHLDKNDKLHNNIAKNDFNQYS